MALFLRNFNPSVFNYFIHFFGIKKLSASNCHVSKLKFLLISKHPLFNKGYKYLMRIISLYLDEKKILSEGFSELYKATSRSEFTSKTNG